MSATSTTGDITSDGAFPWGGGVPSRGFVVHAVLALAALLALNVLVATWVPFAVQGIGHSYLVFFYHFPAALSVFALYGGAAFASAAYLKTRRPVWDVRARSAAAVGVLANAVLLVTGSTWAKAAWNQWWVWDDPRLMSAAVMSLAWVGYLFVQNALEEPERRRVVSAVYGLIAFVNVPIVHFAIKWFGATNHPMKFQDGESDFEIAFTRWYGVAAFAVFYLLLYRLAFDRAAIAERTEATLARVRRIEEGRAVR